MYQKHKTTIWSVAFCLCSIAAMLYWVIADYTINTDGHSFFRYLLVYLRYPVHCLQLGTGLLLILFWPTLRKIAALRYISYVIAPILWCLYTFSAMQLLSHTFWYRLPLEPLLVSLLVLLVLLVLVFALCGNLFVSGCIVSGIMTVGVIANYYTLQFRGSVMLPADILAFGTAAQVAGQYNFELDSRMPLVLCFMLCGCLLLRAYRPIKKQPDPKKKTIYLIKNILLRVSGVIVCVLLIYSINLQPIQKKLGIAVNDWKPTMQNQEEGFLLTFMTNITASFPQRPSGFSTDALEELATKYGEDDSEKANVLPHIIVVMNESFADMDAYSAFEASEPLTPFLYSLRGESNTLWGEVQVPVIGGGTSITEFEFLTGINSRMNSTSTPYDTFISSDVKALPAVMRSLGYRSIAMHPEVARNWSRDEGYPLLGFDEFYHLYSMQNTEKLRSYVSDEAFYREVDLILDQEDTPLFLFGITMQNHGGYEYENFDEPIQILSPSGEYPLATQYINLIHESDRAFEEFIDRCSQRDEPMIVIFFGDHLPRIENDLLNTLTAERLDGSAADALDQYTTPFCIWANFDLNKEDLIEDGSLISVSLLQSQLFAAAGLPKSDYIDCLTQLSEAWPVVSAGCLIDGDGSAYTETDDVLLQDYAYFQYALLRDRLGEELFLPTTAD